jgi:hypothetical protein
MGIFTDSVNELTDQPPFRGQHKGILPPHEIMMILEASTIFQASISSTLHQELDHIRSSLIPIQNASSHGLSRHPQQPTRLTAIPDRYLSKTVQRSQIGTSMSPFFPLGLSKLTNILCQVSVSDYVCRGKDHPTSRRQDRVGVAVVRFN